jgi:glucose/arabinose dehydrogenase
MEVAPLTVTSQRTEDAMQRERFGIRRARPWVLLPLMWLAAASVGTGDAVPPAVDSSVGPAPHLPPPRKSLLPTVDIAPAHGWPAGAAPAPAEGLAVAPFATGLDHPRWVYVLPNGDVLVAETNAPPSDRAGGVVAFFMDLVMKRAGAATPSANRITLLRDSDRNGEPEMRTTFIDRLNSPFGMALVGNTLYVANTDAVLQYRYERDVTEIIEPGKKVVDLPAGPINHHWTKNLIASRDGARLYVTVGSNSNVGENGMHHEERRAAILEIDPAKGETTVFASGLRNPNGLAWHPETGELWTVVNERDELGNDLVPDYLTAVQRDGFYGWPYSYWGQHIDPRVEPQRPDLVAAAITPDYGLGAHTAPLGLAFYQGNALPEHYRGGAFVGLHGSWNRKPPSGYKVIFVPFVDGKPSGMPRDVLTHFLSGAGKAFGRPVGVAVDAAGALLVADDVGNAIWRVTAASRETS